MAKDNNIELHPKTDEPSGYAKYQDCTPCRVIGMFFKIEALVKFAV